MSLAGITALLGPLGAIIEKVIPDPNKAAEIKAQMQAEMFRADSEFYKAAGSIITTEASGESWLQRNWRPLTMLSFVTIIVNNYIVAPYVAFFGSMFGSDISLPILEIPAGMWGLLQIGIGGYVASRGVEKTVEKIQKGGVPLIGSKLPDGAVTKEDLASDRAALLAELRKY